MFIDEGADVGEAVLWDRVHIESAAPHQAVGIGGRCSHSTVKH